MCMYLLLNVSLNPAQFRLGVNMKIMNTHTKNPNLLNDIFI